MPVRWKPAMRFAAVAAGLYTLAMAIMAHLPFMGKPLVYRTGDYYTWPGGDTWLRFREFDPRQRYDAVIIGSSHAYRGYDPYVFAQRGHKVFNLGSSAQTPLNTYWLVQEFLDSTNTPLLIFDVYMGSFRNRGLESTADLCQNQPSDAAAAGMAFDLRDLRGLNLLAVRCLTDHRQPFYTDTSYQGLGFVPTPDSIKAAAGPPPAAAVSLDPRQRHFFEAIVALCRERGIALVVSSHFERFDRRDLAHQPVASYIGQALAPTGVRYLDFTNAPGIDDRNWFADHSHLNLAGARLFTGQLVDSLEQLGYLPHKP
ncbi:MAG: hypothetical protein KBH07_12335 [Flavobacteriales bacterium]|nr:hypothetical protein [Flavobacteriales bacterium]